METESKRLASETILEWLQRYPVKGHPVLAGEKLRPLWYIGVLPDGRRVFRDECTGIEVDTEKSGIWL